MSSRPEPPRRRVLILVNPAAGRARSGRVGRVAAALERRGVAVTIRAGEPPQGVEQLAREAEPEFDALVAAGGDGTVAAAVNGIAAAPRPLAILPLGTANVLARGLGLPRRAAALAEIIAAAPRPLAILPLGTANVLARGLGLPRRAAALAEIIATAPARDFWPGRIGDRLFVAMASSGFDAAVVAAVDARLKRRAGRLAYAAAMLSCLRRYREPELRVATAEGEFRGAAVIAARCRCYAGGFTIAPEAELAVPLLHLSVIAGGGRRAVLRSLAALVCGRLPDAGFVTRVTTGAATLSGPAGVPVEADGDAAGSLPVRLGLAPRPVPLICPAPAQL